MHHKLGITGSDPVPVEINSGILIKLLDMTTNQEETDTIIVHQVAYMQAERVLMMADDTDIFVLLLPFCCQGDISSSVLLAAHGVTGCNTVATYFGIGKTGVLKMLQSGRYSLSSMGVTSCLLSEITSQATRFILACYG